MGKIIKRLFILISVACLLSVSLCGCYDANEIDDLAYAYAIGLDSGKESNLKLTLQLAVPKAIGSGGDSGGGKSFTSITIEGPSIYTCLNLANAFVSRKINLTHAHIIVFSEELARKGIGSYMHEINRGKEFRGGMMLIVSKCSAEEYLSGIQLPIELTPRKQYELMHESYKHTGLTAKVEFLKFYFKTEDTSSEPVALLGNISKYKSSDEFSRKNSTYLEKGRDEPLGGEYIAGNIPEVSEWKNQRIGLAVFKGEKMVGELDGQECLLHLIINNELVSSNITMQGPISKNQHVVFDISRGRNTKSEVKIEGTNPKIKVEVFLEGDIVSVQSDINYTEYDNLTTLETHVEEFFKEELLRFLEKTAKVFESDICGFGAQAKKQFLTWDEWLAFDWLEIYKNASFDVEVSFRIRRPGLMLRTHDEYEGTE